MSDSVEPTTPEAPAAAEPKTQGELPDWARKQISDANQEAANYRVQLREAQTARQSLEEQVSALAVEKSSAVTASSSIQVDFDKLVTAIQAEVPLDKVFSFAKTLQGSTAEDLASHAAELKEMFGLPTAPERAVDRSQGLGAGEIDATPASAFSSFLNSQLSR
jgi:hypothetical protein